MIESGNQKLSTKDKLWVVLAVALFVAAFAVILVFGVF